VITLRPRGWRYLEGSELERSLLGENLDVLAVTVRDRRPRELVLQLRFRGTPARAVTVSCVSDPAALGDGYLPPAGPVPFTVEISQAHGESPEMEFLADRTALIFLRRLGGFLEHGESGREFSTAGEFASYLSEKKYSWPAHLRRRIRHRFGISEQHFESNVVINDEPIDLALFPPRLDHAPENAIWIFRLADAGDRAARGSFKKILQRHKSIRRGILIAGDGLRCYERRLYPDGARAERIPFADLALTPDATFGLVPSDDGTDAFRCAPMGLKGFLEFLGPELTDRSFVVVHAETSGKPMVETMRAAGVPARPGPGGTALLDFAALMRLRRVRALGRSDLVIADLPPNAEVPEIERGRPVDPASLRRRLGSRFVYSGKDDVMMTIHVGQRRDALRLCALTLRRYLRYYRPDVATAHSPHVAIVEELRPILERRYLILPEAGPLEEGGRIALDLYESQRLWRATGQESLERVARVLYEPTTERWTVRSFA
jgi:hypothetical protein